MSVLACLIYWSHNQVIEQFPTKICDGNFELTDKMDINHYLGIDIQQIDEGVILTQLRIIEQIINVSGLNE